MTRLRAFVWHFLISVAIVMPVCFIVFLVWYPQPYFSVVDAWYLIGILVIVNFIIGPLLTLIIFKAGKPGLKFDLCFIAAFQVAALAYGTTVIYQERPYFLVFAVDRFEVVRKKDIDISELRFDALQEKPVIGTVLIIARLPEDPQELSDFAAGVVFDGMPDLERRPELWHPYADYAHEVTAEARVLDELLAEQPEFADLASQTIQKFAADHARLGFVPLIGRTSDFSMVLDLETGEQLEVLHIDPYQLIVEDELPVHGDTAVDAEQS